MTAIEIARRLASLGQAADAVRAYTLAIRGELAPAELLEAAAYLLDNGGDYRISYTCFQALYNQGFRREDILKLMTAVFYEPNAKVLQARYEDNCKHLARYPYLFRKDFLPFDQLPIRFFPYDDHNGYVPFYRAEGRFDAFVNVGNPVISRNFFADLEQPILATDVFSQYELEYLNDNVRKSEDVARENHIYLHYTDWAAFCAWLQVLDIGPLVKSKKAVFLMEEEAAQYPIDFKARFGIDYSQYSIRPVGIREISRMIWHTQLSSHNGGDFFNEIFDAHPNLLFLPSIMLSDFEEAAKNLWEDVSQAGCLDEAQRALKRMGDPRIIRELYQLRNPTEKDCLVAMYLFDKKAMSFVDPASRIAPALFFQPHFPNIIYRLWTSPSGDTVLEADNEEQIHASPLFKGFPYIKTFTPMRRFTTSHGGTMKFLHAQVRDPNGEGAVVTGDTISERILNRSFMIDPEDRLYRDSILVRFEDGKLNPKATFTALAAFLDLPYTESMTYCSEQGKHDPYIYDEARGVEKVAGFNLSTVYNTYDDYVNDAERYFLEFFLRDAYAFYGYGFQTYDGKPVDEEKAAELIRNFSTINYHMRRSWKLVFGELAAAAVKKDRFLEERKEEVQEELLNQYMADLDKKRLEIASVLLKDLRFINRNGQPLQMMPKLPLDPALLEQPLYH